MPELWDHQRMAVETLDARPSVLLGFDMGTGKSRVVVEHVQRRRPPLTIIACPKSVVGVWPDQFRQHLDEPDSVSVFAAVKGTVARKLADARAAGTDAKAAGKPFVLVVNHEAAWREPMASALLAPRWGLLVVDESHRGTSTPRSKFYRWAWRVKADRRACLSGTPMSHSPANIWPQWKLLDPSTCDRTFTQFKSRYAIIGGYRVNGKAVQVLGWRHLDELEYRIRHFMLRVRKQDVLDLPPQIHVDQIIELPRDARRAYDQLELTMRADVERGEVTAANALAKTMRLQQMAQGDAVVDGGRVTRLHEAKRDALAEVFADLPDDEPVVVFAKFHGDLDAIAQAARDAGRSVDELSGRRNEIGAKWNPNPGAVAAVQIQAGGVGIDLTASAYCVFYSQSWSLAEYDQAVARQDRPGQTRSVTYTHLIAEGTIDEAIRRATARRRKVVDEIMDRLKSNHANSTEGSCRLSTTSSSSYATGS